MAIGLYTDANAAPSVNDLPSYNPNGSSNVAVTYTGNKNMNVKMTGKANSVGTANWSSFNVGKNAKVNFEFTKANQKALNKVTGTKMSEIYGSITNSGAGASTGTVILVNPNGITFGSGANVNLNSFTAAAFDGVFGKTSSESEFLYFLKGKKGSDKNGNITVQGGAKIYGTDSVSLVGKNVSTYQGSKISTSKAGEVYIATVDNNDSFVLGDRYDKNNQTALATTNVNTSNKGMKIDLNGEIIAGNISIRNNSKNKASKINVSNAILKADTASESLNGIYLYSQNDVYIDNSTISSNAGLNINASNKLHIDNTEISAKGSDWFGKGVGLYAQDLHIDNSNVTSSKDYIYISGNNNLHIDNTALNAKNSDITLNSEKGSVSIDNNTIKANNVKISAEKKVSVDNNNIINKGEILLEAKNTKNISFDKNTVKKNNVKKQVKPVMYYY